MNTDDATSFLQRVHLLDKRRVDEATIAHWQALLEAYTLPECIRALEAHAKSETAYLQPAHIIRRVKSEREHAASMRRIPDARVEAPKPDNFEAMCAAWNDPVAFEREVRKYDEQLVAAGFSPTRTTRAHWDDR